jgi:hypothetical protein
LLSFGGVMGLGGVAVAVAPAGLAADSPLEMVDTGLDNPRGLDSGSAGVFYINGNQERVVEGLPSLRAQSANTSLGGVFITSQLASGSGIMVTPKGGRKALASEGRIMPTGMAMGLDGYPYIPDHGVFAGRGEVVRLPVDVVVVEESESANEGDRGGREKNEMKSRVTGGKGRDAGGSATDDAERGNRKSGRADSHVQP